MLVLLAVGDEYGCEGGVSERVVGWEAAGCDGGEASWVDVGRVGGGFEGYGYAVAGWGCDEWCC